MYNESMRLSYYVAVIMGMAFIAGLYAVVLTQPKFMKYEQMVISCDANNPCEQNKGDCYKFPDEETAICYKGDPCEICSSNKCVVMESYPMQIRCL